MAIVRRATYYVVTKEVVLREYQLQLDPGCHFSEAIAQLDHEHDHEPDRIQYEGEEVATVIRKDGKQFSGRGV